jgi:hypothetical protein
LATAAVWESTIPSPSAPTGASKSQINATKRVEAVIVANFFDIIVLTEVAS